MAVGSRLHASALALSILLFGATWLPAQQEFVRGDFNGDDQVALQDVLATLAFIYSDGPGPVSSCGVNGPQNLDVADYNDNEFITIADPLRLIHFLFQNPGLPQFPPAVACGPDPDQSQRGFDVVDPDFEVLLGEPLVTPPTGPNRIAQYPIYLSTTESTVGLELYFAITNVQALSNPTFVGTTNVALEQVIFNVVILRLGDPFMPLSLGQGTSFLGFLQFDLTDGFDPPDLDWAPEFFEGYPRRATLVDSSFEDHLPLFTAISTPVFIRGDVTGGLGSLSEGDGLVNEQDLTYLWNYVFNPTLPLPLPICGPLEVFDAFDINDNEVLTIADVLLLEAVLAGDAVVPAPNECGPDLNETTNGFDQRDPNYAILADDLDIVIQSASDIRAEIDFSVISSAPVRGLEFTLRVPPDVIPHDPLFVPDPGLLQSVEVQSQLADARLSITIYSLDGPFLPALDGVRQPLGVMLFDLDQPALPAPIGFTPDAIVGLRSVRATIVDDLFQDHHPILGAGVNAFIRGDANSQHGINGPVDIGDPISIFNFLFPPNPPVPTAPITCLDALDVNNDGSVDIGDAVSALNWLFGVSPTIPHPFPACGFDSDIDLLDCQDYPLCP